MQALVVEFRIKPAFVEAFAQAIADNARTSRSLEPGCRQFDVCRDPGDTGRFLLYELYDDDAAIQAHLKSTHFLAMNTATTPWVETKSVARYTRTEP